MKKQLFIVVLLVLGFQVTLEGITPPVLLTNESIELVDGLPDAIDAETIYLMRKLQSQISAMFRGRRQPDGSFLGSYELNGKKYSLNELIEIESDMKNRTTSTTTKEFNEGLDKLDSAFELVKDDFSQCTEPFIEKIQKAKQKIVELIEESCEKRGLENSLLLGWGETTDEKAYFEKSVKSLNLFKTFLNDLSNFLNDLMYSCKIGWSQYVEYMKTLK